MLCANEFCFYWENSKCRLEQIELDARGCCLTRILLDLSAQALQTAKDTLRQRYVEDESAC